MDENIQEQAEALANNAMAPGIFNIVEAIKGRAYPSTKVDIFLDEDTAFRASEIQERIDELTNTADDSDVVDEVDALKAELDVAVRELEASKYVFLIGGISEGEREDLLNKAIEKFPLEYDENKNPFTGEVTKTETENKGRDRYFTSLLWGAQIRKITAPDGAEQVKIPIATIDELRRSLPIAGIARINEAVEKVRISTAVFMAKVNEDFLAKS